MLFVALIVLIIMTLAGLALLRQMGVGTSIAGNIAFKENATSVADRGTEFANRWLFAITRSLPPIRSPTATSRTGAPASIRPPSTGMRSRSCSSTTRRRPATGRASSSIGCASSRTGVRSLRTRTAPIRRSSTPATRAAAASYPGVLPGTHQQAVLPHHDPRRRAPKHDQLHPSSGSVIASAGRNHENRHEKRRALLSTSPPRRAWRGSRAGDDACLDQPGRRRRTSRRLRSPRPRRRW